MEERFVEPGSETDRALDRALEAAQLRAGDSSGASLTATVSDPELSAAEAGDAGSAADGE